MGTLTEGAIGYRHFDMLSGSKRMLELVKGDGKHLPFAAEVFNDKGQQLGMVGDEGMAYLAGLHEGSAVEARWAAISIVASIYRRRCLPWRRWQD
ncbi:FimD/PapC C-terminal domain-containing protein [Aeromonas hydrophila]